MFIYISVCFFLLGVAYLFQTNHLMHCICVEGTIETYVGFTTKLSGAFNSNTVIKGSEVLFNYGNAYNGTVFNCPSPGLYLFQVSIIISDSNSGIWIYKNSKSLTLVYSGDNPQRNGASVSAAVWLNTGDHVYLLSHGSQILDHNSVFTGVKIN